MKLVCKSGNPKSRITAVLAVSKSGQMMTPTVIKRSSARGASSRLMVEEGEGEGESAYSLGQKNISRHYAHLDGKGVYTAE